MSLTSSTFSLLCEGEAQFDSINTGLRDKPFGVPPSPGSCGAVAQPLPRCPPGVMGTGLMLGGILASRKAQVLWAALGAAPNLPAWWGGQRGPSQSCARRTGAAAAPAGGHFWLCFPRIIINPNSPLSSIKAGQGQHERMSPWLGASAEPQRAGARH